MDQTKWAKLGTNTRYHKNVLKRRSILKTILGLIEETLTLTSNVRKSNKNYGSLKKEMYSTLKPEEAFNFSYFIGVKSVQLVLSSCRVYLNDYDPIGIMALSCQNHKLMAQYYKQCLLKIALKVIDNA